MSKEMKTKTICKDAICKNGQNLCCHECPDVGDCKDLWKCKEHIDFYKNCKKQEG